MTLFASEHLGQDQPAEDHRRLQVHAQNLANLLFLQLMIKRGVLDTGIIDQDVYRAEAAPYGGQHFASPVRFAQIRGNSDGFRAAVGN